MRPTSLHLAFTMTLVGGCGIPYLEGSAQAAPPQQSLDERIAHGKELYGRYCKLCHGSEADGYAADHASQLRNVTFLATASTPFLWLGIEYGRAGTPMSAFGNKLGGPLDEGDIKSLIDYLRSLNRLDLENVKVAGDANAGRKVYADHCALCHGEHGEGKTAVSLSNPHFLATASDGFIRFAIEHGRPGTAMTGFAGRLSAAQMDDVASFIRTWAHHVGTSVPVAEPAPRLDQLVLNPKGAAPSFRNLREGRFVSASDVYAAYKGGARMVIFDARPKSDWLKSHIPGAYPAPFYDEVDPKVRAVLPTDGTWIVSYCACPHAASGEVTDKLRALGFSHAVVLDEGFLEWFKRGYPTTFGKSE